LINQSGTTPNSLLFEVEGFFNGSHKQKPGQETETETEASDTFPLLPIAPGKHARHKIFDIL
jgi:hypothetical protein